MQQMQAQLGFVSSEKFIEARLVVRCPQSHPGGSNGLMIEMSDAMVQQKFHELAAAVLGVEKADKAQNAIWRVDAMPDVSRLIPLLTK